MRCHVALCLVFCTAVPGLAHASGPDAVGGGTTDSGLEGSYYSNASLAGEPAFVRRDARIQFDWSEGRPVGGSRSAGYRDYPARGFSVRWAGQLIPRFTEAYTFLGQAGGGIRLKIRKAGEADWKVLVDRWDAAGPYESAPAPLSAGALYDIEVEYRALGDEPGCALEWKSRSTPREVLDPVVQHGLNTGSWDDYVWADLVKSRRYGDDTHVDEHGWPTKSGVELVAGEMSTDDPELAGTYLLRFGGLAEVQQRCCDSPIFEADGQTFEGTLPKGLGYDPASNTTTASMTVRGSRFMLHFQDAQRSKGQPDSGVTGIRLMRPIHSGSRQHHRLDEVVYRPFKDAIDRHFTVLRWGKGASSDVSGRWADRQLPEDAFLARPGGQGNLEHLIMLANETGKDLYLSTPVAADDEYFTKLARLLRYGSDGKEPYTAPTAAPRYPPLNPNLRVYVEVGNEIWNWDFGSTGLAQRLSKREHDAGSGTWAAIDFDGRAGNPEHMGAVRRWHVLRTLACSEAFREVFGDEGMGSRVRVLLEYQYDNYQNTAILSLDYLDRYLRHRAAATEQSYQPVSHHVWGAGGATYYGLANKDGSQTEIVLGNASFESPALAAATIERQPSSPPWSFEGQAGIVHPGTAERVGPLTHLPRPQSGNQAAFIRGRGKITQSVRFTRPGRYAVAFNAAGSGQRWPGYLPFDVFVDDEKVSPRGQSDTRVSTGHTTLGGWGRDTRSLGEEWGTAVFQIEEPGEHEIRFLGRGDAEDYVLIDDVRIASVDALMDGGFGTGEALGQVAEANYERQLRGQATYARAFGLQVVAYEAGWSVGGDFHQSPLQTWAKLHDPRARAINNRAIELWEESGSFMNVWGVFTYWPSWDFGNAANYPIMQSLRDATRSLPAEAKYGRSLPATLRPEDSDLSVTERQGGSSWWDRVRNVLCSDDAPEVWFAWMVIAPERKTYEVQVRARGPGSLILELDGKILAHYESLDGGSLPPRSAEMTQGAHAFRVVAVGDAKIEEILVTERAD